MVDQIRRGARLHVYLDEWLVHFGLSYERFGGRIGVSRQTVHRWANGERELTPDKISGIAEALDIEPERLFRVPGRPSLDAIMKDASPEDIRAIIDFAERWIARKSA